MKTAKIGLVLVLIVTLTAPVFAEHRPTKVAGGLLIAGGAGLMLGAFNYGSSCPAGYSTHTFQNLPTQCVWVSSYTFDSDVREASPYMDYRRPKLMYAGIGAVTAGIVLLAIPTKKTSKVSLNLTGPKSAEVKYRW